MIARSVEGFGRLVAVAAITLLAATASARAAGPFSGLNGRWTGTGHIALDNGTKERIRCRASYAVEPGGRAMHQALRCASDSYNFELRSDVESHGDKITGNWSELSRKVSGSLSGYAHRGRIEVDVKSETFNATLVLLSRGNRQLVTIKSKGTQFTGATIRLVRQG